MKKIICALFCCFFAVSVFADSVTNDVVSGKYDTKAELWIPRSFFLSLGVADKPLSQTAVDAMVAKYDELAETEESGLGRVSGGGSGYFTYKDGSKPLTLRDLGQICKAGGLNTKQLCLDYVVDPIYAELKLIRFDNSCFHITGGERHCVDNVFVKDYDTLVQGEWKSASSATGAELNPHNYASPGKPGTVVDNTNNRYRVDHIETKKSNNLKAQDVKVSEWIAFGFAIEYAKAHGHNVICNSQIDDNWVNCTTYGKERNQHFYSFRFADTNNTDDSAVEKSISKGICALLEREVFDNGVGAYGCMGECDASIKGVVDKFGMTAQTFTYGEVDTVQKCKLSRQEILNNSFQTYPGYEYMSYAFKEIQTVFEPSLVTILKSYIQAQGIDVKSFTCDYGTKSYKEKILKDGDVGVTVNKDDVLRCYVNNVPVDFVFDDLFESKEYARDVSKTGMKCLMMKRENGETASFDGKYCKGPTETQCKELSAKVLGGTRWDSGAGACVLKDAAKVKTIQTAITITGGAAFAIGVTVLTGGSMAMVLLEAGTSVLLDLSLEGVNRFYETRPHHLATNFIRAAQNCGLVDASNMNKCSNKVCVQNLVSKYMASLDSVIGDGVDALNDEELKVVDGVYGRIGECLTDSEIKLSIKNSDILSVDKLMSKASMAVVVGGFFVSPSNSMTKLSRLPKTAKILSRAGLKPIERVSSSLGGAKYSRVYVKDLKISEIEDIVNELQTQGFYVSSNMDEAGRQFIAFADGNVFGLWNKSDANWFFRQTAGNSAGSGYKSMQDIRGINFSELKQRAVYNNGVQDYVLTGLIDNSMFFDKLSSVYNKEITRIGKAPVKIVDSGQISGRAIVVVDVGGRHIPFYVSTGTAGKIDVPTGKWEVFFGIGGGGWFNKTNLNDIVNHYGSEELRQIASKLDEVLGDPRNRLYVGLSESRVNQGGVGLVGDVDNMGTISNQSVNSGFRYVPNYSNKSGESNMSQNIEDIKSYLKGLKG